MAFGLWTSLLSGCDWAASHPSNPMNAHLSEEDKALKFKFRDLGGGQLRVDAIDEIQGVTILNEHGQVFFSRATVSLRKNSAHSYGAEFGVPRTLRVLWRKNGPEVDGVIQNPIRMTDVYGIHTGGIVLGDYTVPVASRIPEELLEARREGVGGFRLKIRIHQDGPLIGWDLSRGFNLQDFAGGDFREADIENGKVLRKGWYIDPKTRQKIETDF